MVNKSATRILLLIVSTLALSLCGAVLFGQSSSAGAAQTQVPMPPPPPPGGGWGGARLGFLGLEESLAGKVVTGAPYSAQAVTERVQVLADGNKIDQKTTANVYRDSEGRTRREQTMGPIGPWATPENAPPMVMINDPVGGVGYLLNSQNHTAIKHPLGLAGALNPKRQARQAKRQEVAGQSTATRESLGKQTMAGVEVEGTRTTVTIPAGAIGNAQPIQIVSERWYSPALHVVVMSTRDDPRFGHVVYQLTNINMSEPDTSLFQVPSDYSVKDGRSLFRHAPPPPPPPAD